jgi:diketogulonate reductase-like aldo/keto reductase
MLQYPLITLGNGVKIPQLGLGVFRSEPGDETVKSVEMALEAGYRHIDTATMYGNEKDVATGLKASGVKREDVFITTKLATRMIEAKQAEEGLKASMEMLETDYIDLYLVHWPVPNYLAAWETIIRWYEDKKLRAIGVSNFQTRHLEAIEKAGLLKPVVNQIELHPLFQQSEIKPYCEKRGIAIEAWAPIGGKDHLCIDHPVILAIAGKHGKSGAQVVLRWHIQIGNIVMPKSIRKERIIENADIFNFTLDGDDMAAIAALDTGKRLYWSPDRFE